MARLHGKSRQTPKRRVFPAPIHICMCCLRPKRRRYKKATHLCAHRVSPKKWCFRPSLGARLVGAGIVILQLHFLFTLYSWDILCPIPTARLFTLHTAQRCNTWIGLSTFFYESGKSGLVVENQRILRLSRSVGRYVDGNTTLN